MGPRLRADAPLMPTPSRTRTMHCLWSFWKPGSSHFGLALTSPRPRTTSNPGQRPSIHHRVSSRACRCAWAGRGWGCACCVCVCVRVCGASPAHAQQASPAAAHAQWVWQLCLHQRLEAVGFLPQTSPRPWPCPSGTTRLNRAGPSTSPRPWPTPSSPGASRAPPCLALNDPWSHLFAWPRTTPRDRTGEHMCPQTTRQDREAAEAELLFP